MPCKSTYTLAGDVITVTCGGTDCPKGVRKVGGKYETVEAKCMDVTEVAFDGNEFVMGKQQCVCAFIPSGDDCKLEVQNDGHTPPKLVKVKCTGSCASYYKAKDETEPIHVKCKLVIDHKDNHKVKCICIVLTQEEIEKEQEDAKKKPNK